MEIREMMTKHPEACLADDTCAMALEIMRRRRCGFMPVVKQHATNEVLGVVTDRDIALHLERVDCAPSQAFLEECMTRHPQTIAPDAELEEAAGLMETLAVHRLPVAEQDRLVGVLSLSDIALAARREWKQAGPHRTEQQLADIVEEIAAAQRGAEAP